MVALELCHSSQSVVFNSLKGPALKFKYRMAVDGVKEQGVGVGVWVWLGAVRVCVSEERAWVKAI